MNDAGAKVIDLIFGQWRSQILYAGVQLGQVLSDVVPCIQDAGDDGGREGIASEETRQRGRMDSATSGGPWGVGATRPLDSGAVAGSVA